MIDGAREPTVAAEPRAQTYRPDIDGLRGVAILIVLGFHAFPDLITGGYVGVDVFFVISGFLITGIIREPLQQGRFSFRSFYARRIRRLYPALVTVLAALLVIGWFALSPPDLEVLGKYTLGSAAFVPNLILWREAGYFDRAALSKPLLHLWSLGIEEQFYLAWPATLYALTRLRLALPISLGAIAAVSFVACVVVTGTDITAAFYLPVTRAWELALGGLLAVHVATDRMRNVEDLLVRHRDVASIAGASLIGVAVLLLSERTEFPGVAALLPTLGAALIIAAGPDALVNRVLSLGGVVFVGLISYSLYLWHWPLLSLASIDALGLPPAAQRVEILAISFVLATLTYRFIERPFRGSRRQGWHVSLLVAAMLVVAAAGSVISHNEGFKSRYPISIQAVLDYRSYPAGKDARAGQCWVSFQEFSSECFLQPDVAQKDGVVVWGDSYAGRLYVGVRAALGPNAHIAQFNRDTCVPLLIAGPCEAANERVMGIIEKMKPRTAIMFGNWNASTKSNDWQPGGKAFSRMQQTIDRLQAAGVVKIVLFGPAPRWKADLPQLLFDDWQAQREPKLVPERMSANLDPEGPPIDRGMRAIAQDRKLTYVSLLDMLCNVNGCLTYVPEQPGKLLTWDVGHLTSEGAIYVIRRLVLDGVLSN